MNATVTRIAPDRIAVDFIPDELGARWRGGEYDSGDPRDGRNGIPAHVEFKVGRLHYVRPTRTGYVINGADEAGWCAWIALRLAGLVLTHDGGPATMGDIEIELEPSVAAGIR